MGYGRSNLKFHSEPIYAASGKYLNNELKMVLKTKDLLNYKTDYRFSLHRLVTDVEMTLISL